MTEGAFVKFNSKQDVEKKVKYLIQNMLDWDFSKPLAVKLEPYQDPRSLNQNALFHMWCREIAKGKLLQKVKPSMIIMFCRSFLHG